MITQKEVIKYFEKIEDIINSNKDIIGCGKAVAERANVRRKQKEIQEILEEVYQQGRDDKEKDMYEDLYG